MQLLVFAHVPPPHHGQSAMVKQLLDGLALAEAGGGPGPITCHHVDARYSSDAQDVGGFRVGKVVHLVRYCAQALQLRLTTGVRTLYFVPAPPRRVPLLRDIATLLVLRPFFPRIVLHWHASGLGAWLTMQPAWLRVPARAVLGRTSLSIALAAQSEPDARMLAPRRSSVVHYGIPDPIPDFAERVGPQRAARAREISDALAAAGGEILRVRVLFLALCTREKGLFDALAAVAEANRRLAQAAKPLRLELHVAGAFRDRAEQSQVEAIAAGPEWHGLYRYHGFVDGEAKRQLLEHADLILFPTFYAAESFPLVVLEGMAAGLPIVTTRWRAIPEMLPPDYPGLVPPHDVDALATQPLALAGGSRDADLRARYLAHFTADRFLEAMAEALQSVERP